MPSLLRRRVALRAEILDGDVPLEAVERRLLELRERYRVREIATDRGAFLRSAELLAARAMPVVETPHSPERSDRRGDSIRADGRRRTLSRDNRRGVNAHPYMTLGPSDHSWKCLRAAGRSVADSRSTACHA